MRLQAKKEAALDYIRRKSMVSLQITASDEDEDEYGSGQGSDGEQSGGGASDYTDGDQYSNDDQYAFLRDQ